MSRKLIALFVLLIAFLFILFNSFFIISAIQKGVLLRFGQVIRNDIPPGLHWKIPFIDQVKYFDGRLQTLDLPSERFLTREKKALIVDAYIKWKISDVSTFYKASSGNMLLTNSLLAQRTESRMRNQFGNLILTDVVSDRRDEMMEKITSELNTIASRELGVNVIDVRIKRIDLPPQVSDSVFQRMASEREKEAQEYRSKGKEQAEGIQATADKQVRVILANAFEKAETVKGIADAKAASIYAKAYVKDPEFYAFYRSLQAYRTTFSSPKDILLLTPSSQFFKYLQQSTIKPEK